MEFRYIEVDHTFRERIHFKDDSFPVDVCIDAYDSFIDGTMNCHWHGEFELGLMLEGELDYYLNDTHLPLEKGDCVFVNSNTMHMASQRPGGQSAVMCTVAFPAALFAGNVNDTLYARYIQPVLGSASQGFVLPAGSPHTRAIVEALSEVYQLDSAAFGYELRCLALLCQAWQALAAHMAATGEQHFSHSHTARHEQRAKQILSFIQAHYAESITVEDIARHLSISRTECFRCFKRLTNKNPAEYLADYRLARACRLLLETGDSIAAVGQACGFGSSSYFGRQFRQKFGLSPSHFRQRGRQAAP